MSADEDPYAVLGVPPDADARAIKKAYFALVRRHPPERAPEEFQRLRRAYEQLSAAAAPSPSAHPSTGGPLPAERAEAHLRAGRAQQALGHYLLAIASFERAAALAPDDPRPREGIAACVAAVDALPAPRAAAAAPDLAPRRELRRRGPILLGALVLALAAAALACARLAGLL
jgi:Flp pilus assembly protein TadD